ncbi:MAG: BMP family ABC transporter substrate-binding protein [Qingshengfaniella sp.]
MMLKLAAAATAGALTATAALAETLEIGLMVPSPVADTGWSRTLADGLNVVKEKYGDAVSVEIVENIQEGADADRIMNKMVADGDRFLVLGSFGYMNSGVKLAQRHADLTILHASGFKTAPNLSPFAAKYFEGSYLIGMAAASLTKTKKIGVVSAFAIPELISTINGLTLGARSVDPDIEVSVIWINSWFDPAKAQDSARALIAQGNDVLFSNSQDTPSVVTVGEEKGVYVANLNSTMRSYAPTKYLGVVKTDWSPLFLRAVEAHLNGTFTGQSEWLGMADDAVIVADLSPDLSPEILTRIEDTEAAIRAGDFQVYAGPIVNQSGEEVIGAGAVLSTEQVLGMDWHVQGVVSPLPK